MGCFVGIRSTNSALEIAESVVTNLIEMSNISKSFGGSVALSNVSLTLLPGTVHALIGENGAGKSTLMKILAGVYTPDSGEIYKNGNKLEFANPKEALDFGVSTVFQELSLLPNLTIAENMFLGREPTTRFGGIDYTAMQVDTAEALAALGLTLDPTTLVAGLNLADRQFVEIAHGITADASIFILDEPTAALNAADVEVLHAQIRHLKETGKAIVYISHRIEEVFKICDTVTVLKDGRNVATKPVSAMTRDLLIAMMVGRDLEDIFPNRANDAGEIMLDVAHFKISATSKPFSLSVYAGEIVALAGLEGQGQQQFIRSIVGQFQPYGGTVRIKNKPLAIPSSTSNGIRKLQKLGVGFIPEDRSDEGLFLQLPILHNIAISLHSANSQMSIAQHYHAKVALTMTSMNIKAASASALVSSLSGGNQQKVLLGRYLIAGIDILLIEEPTRGVDIGSKSEIYKLLRGFTARGGAVLVLSRETIELIGLCDRIYVVHDNTIVDEMLATAATEHKILDAALKA